MPRKKAEMYQWVVFSLVVRSLWRSWHQPTTEIPLSPGSLSLSTVRYSILSSQYVLSQPKMIIRTRHCFWHDFILRVPPWQSQQPAVCLEHEASRRPSVKAMSSLNTRLIPTTFLGFSGKRFFSLNQDIHFNVDTAAGTAGHL
jgi:hypothetical protein